MERTRGKPVYFNTEQLAIEAFRSDNYLIVNKTLIQKLGLIQAVLLSNYIEKYVYFKSKEQDEDGWFYCTHEQQEEQLTLGVRVIRENKKELIDKGILITKWKGLPAKEWIKIDFAKLLNRVGLALTNREGLPLQIEMAYNNIKSNNISPIINNRRESVKLKAEKYLPIAEYLHDIILTKKNIKHSPKQIKGWANAIRLLVEENNVDVHRVKQALKWYKKHIDDPYTPVIESGQSLRVKFPKLEAAVNRQLHPRQEKEVPPIYDDIHGKFIWDPVTKQHRHCISGDVYIP